MLQHDKVAFLGYGDDLNVLLFIVCVLDPAGQVRAKVPRDGGCSLPLRHVTGIWCLRCEIAGFSWLLRIALCS